MKGNIGESFEKNYNHLTRGLVSSNSKLTSSRRWLGNNIQPSIVMGISGFELVFWDSSILANTNTSEDNYAFSHEVDVWAGYSYRFKSGMTIGIVITDYYFPNAGIRFGNFNNYLICGFSL